MSLIQVSSMPDNAFHMSEPDGIILGQIPEENSLRQVIFRSGIWLFGLVFYLIGMLGYTYGLACDGAVTIEDFWHLLTMVLMFTGWVYLKPQGNAGREIKPHAYNAFVEPQMHLEPAHARMAQLQQHHLVSQEYVLPFPYICQIYHLLNLKHLETVHNFSLNNLKVGNVSEFQPTENGGKLRFQTTLSSPVNVLRLWRQPAVDVELTLHTPFTIELRVPVRNDKAINVLFNVLPLSQDEHRFCVDIYSNLPWPKSLLRFALEFASSLTLLEDLPYLQKLNTCKQKVFCCAGENPGCRDSRCRDSGCRDSGCRDPIDTMQLYHRYVSLYICPSCKKIPTTGCECRSSACKLELGTRHYEAVLSHLPQA